MIISASRRTDIPAFYPRWFMNRLRAGFCLVPNPWNTDQVSRISLKPEDVDAIVFWSKDPTPLMPHLGELDRWGYRYYFQFTLNSYPRALEPGILPLGRRLDAFRRLSYRIGPERVVWRYDPIIVSNLTGPDFHRQQFARLARELSGATRRVMVSLVEFYRKTERRLSRLERQGFSFDREAASSPDIASLLSDLALIAKSYGMEIFTCAQERDFSQVGVPPGRCIDGDLINRLWGLSGHTQKDPGQREHCRCVVSRDIGVNDTCLHGCPYCYATINNAVSRQRYREHDPNSEVIWGHTAVTPVATGDSCQQGSLL